MNCDNDNNDCNDCSKHVYPDIQVDNPCCEPDNRNAKLDLGLDCGVTQAFDGPRKGIEGGKSTMDGSNRGQGLESLRYYDGCCTWKDIKYLQPLDLENVFDPPKHEYDNYNRTRMNALRDFNIPDQIKRGLEFANRRPTLDQFLQSLN